MRHHAPPQTTLYLISPPVRELLTRHRKHGHVHVMSAYRSGLGSSPRKKLNLLWYVAPAADLLTVQASEPPVWPGKLGEVHSSGTVTYPYEGDLVEIVVERSCQKTPPSHTPEALRAELERHGPDGLKLGKAYRSRPVIVPETERPEWAVGRLAAIGLAPHRETVRVGPLAFAGLGSQRRGIPYVEIRAHAHVADADKFAGALDAGTGKGRNYGLGLIRVRPITA